MSANQSTDETDADTNETVEITVEHWIRTAINKQRSIPPLQITFTLPVNQQENSLFCQLPHVLFVVICSFLDLECKCRTFTVLSQSIRAAFGPSTCCCGHVTFHFDTSQFDLDTSTSLSVNWLERCLGQLSYIEHAKSIDLLVCTYDQSWLPADYDGLLEGVLKAISSGHVQSLTLRACDMDVEEMVINHIAQSRLDNLTELNVYQPRDGYIGKDSVIKLLDALPDSLTALYIGLHYYREYSTALLFGKLRDPCWLPNLKNFQHDYFQPSLATVMTASGRARTIERMSAYLLDMHITNQFDWCWNVQTLHLYLLEHQLHDLCALADNVLPSLRELSFAVNRTDTDKLFTDMTPLLMFVSVRPVVQVQSKYGNTNVNLIEPINSLRHIQSEF